MREDQETCEHVSINRVLDLYICNGCGARFKPENPKLANPWKNQSLFKKVS